MACHLGGCATPEFLLRFAPPHWFPLVPYSSASSFVIPCNHQNSKARVTRHPLISSRIPPFSRNTESLSTHESWPEAGLSVIVVGPRVIAPQPRPEETWHWHHRAPLCSPRGGRVACDAEELPCLVHNRTDDRRK